MGLEGCRLTALESWSRSSFFQYRFPGSLGRNQKKSCLRLVIGGILQTSGPLNALRGRESRTRENRTQKKRADENTAAVEINLFALKRQRGRTL
ncbi:unnamed protein product [Nezara viridula]|uniref:Uncharacterized protein n=1 Tax=Nezara viridula TaxID=85310 RepID=A0A9P0MMZ4_NEZVI|nr:unnamed protein product [Nezara viridula]